MINTLTTYLSVVSGMLVNPDANVYTIDRSSSPITAKGPSTITFNLSNVSEYPFKIVRLKINFDDRDFSPTIIEETRSLGPLSSNILLPKTNTFYPSIRSYYTQFNTEFYFYTEAGYVILVKQPVILAQASMYDDIDNIYLSDSQLIDKKYKYNLLNFTGDKTPYTFSGVLSD